MVRFPKTASLWMILHFFGWEFAHTLSVLMLGIERLRATQGPVPHAERKTLIGAVLLLKRTSETLELRASVEHAASLSAQLGDDLLSRDYLLGRLESLRDAIRIEFEQVRFATVLGAKREYLDAHDLFGTEVHHAFPLAILEIRDAGS